MLVTGQFRPLLSPRSACFLPVLGQKSLVFLPLRLFLLEAIPYVSSPADVHLSTNEEVQLMNLFWTSNDITLASIPRAQYSTCHINIPWWHFWIGPEQDPHSQKQTMARVLSEGPAFSSCLSRLNVNCPQSFSIDGKKSLEPGRWLSGKSVYSSNMRSWSWLPSIHGSRASEVDICNPRAQGWSEKSRSWELTVQKV